MDEQGMTDLAIREPSEIEVFHHMTPEALERAITREKKLRSLIIEYVKSTMKDKHHYYTLQAGQKPSLSKEGALNLASLFKVKVAPAEPRETFHADGHYTVRYRVDLLSAVTGEVLATGDGLCTTYEKKYAYRWVYENQVPLEIKKEELARETFESQDKRRTYTKYKLPNTDLADLWNTTLKMALKRAIVDATLKLPLVSELFTQDLEPSTDEAGDEHIFADKKRAPMEARRTPGPRELRVPAGTSSQAPLSTAPTIEDLIAAVKGAGLTGQDLQQQMRARDFPEKRRELNAKQIEILYRHFRSLPASTLPPQDPETDVPDFAPPAPSTPEPATTEPALTVILPNGDPWEMGQAPPVPEVDDDEEVTIKWKGVLAELAHEMGRGPQLAELKAGRQAFTRVQWQEIWAALVAPEPTTADVVS